MLSANRTPSSCQRVLADLVKEHISDHLVEKENAFSFKVIKQGSDLLIEEFTNYKDLINTKEEIEKI